MQRTIDAKRECRGDSTDRALRRILQRLVVDLFAFASFVGWFGLVLFSFLSYLVIFIDWLAVAVSFPSQLLPGEIVGGIEL